MNNGKGGRIVFLPDAEYRAWVNKNKELLNEIIESGEASTFWLSQGSNKKFLVRYFGECGYSVQID